jgi:mutator protein MutT
MPEIEVAAGLVFREGRLLIAQRRAGDHLGGFWEVPGGKRRAEETFTECLRRELREELGIEVEVLELVEALPHTYPEKTVHLRFYRCRWIRGEPQALGCDAWAWVTRAGLNQYRFPPADERLLKPLARDAALWEPR